MRVYSTKPYPDLEAGLVQWGASLPELAGTATVPFLHVGDELPAEFADRLPFVTFEVGDGPTDGVTWAPEVDVSVYATTRAEAVALSGRLFATMTAYPFHFGGVVADSAEVLSLPRRSKNQEPDDVTYCFVGTVRMSLRR